MISIRFCYTITVIRFFRLQRNLAVRNIPDLSVEIAEKKQTILLHQLRRQFGNMQLQPNGTETPRNIRFIR